MVQHDSFHQSPFILATLTNW